MNRKAFNLMLGLLAATVIGIAGCGDGGGSARNNEVTTADAGPSQNVIVGNLVSLGVSRNTVAVGASTTYQWSIASKPVGSAATLNDPTAVSPTFTADLPGTYLFNLVVNDGNMNSAAATVSVIASASKISKISISSPAADGVFVLQGTGLQGVAGMLISISYDASTLSNPRFAGGPLVEGMISVPNLSNPIQLGIVGSNAIGGSGSGTIGTITFDRTGASPGIITALVIKDLIDAKGNKMATSHSVVVNP